MRGESGGLAYGSLPPRFGASAAPGAAVLATQRTAARPAGATPDFLIIACLRLLLDDSVKSFSGTFSGEARRGSPGKRHGSMESNAPRCKPPSGRLAPPGAPDGSGRSFRPRSGNADGTRSPAAGWSGSAPPLSPVGTRGRPRRAAPAPA